MAKRAERVEETRQRIIEAAVKMHETVGPATTTIAGVAAMAGVTRLTVYRHFPDQEALYAACSAHWMAGQVMPDPGRWSAIEGAVDRFRAGLADLYRYYWEGEAMLARVYGEIASMPEGMRERLAQMELGYRQALLTPFGAKGRNRRLRAVVGHATSFWTWRSLCREQGLTNRDAVEVMTSLALVVARPRAGTRE
jgi:AcrR family transcriptional regulator